MPKSPKTVWLVLFKVGANYKIFYAEQLLLELQITEMNPVIDKDHATLEK